MRKVYHRSTGYAPRRNTGFTPRKPPGLNRSRNRDRNHHIFRLLPAEPFPLPVHTGDVRVDVQSALAMLAPIWGCRPLLDITDTEARDQLARASVMALSYVAQSARGIGRPAVPQARIDQAASIT